MGQSKPDGHSIKRVDIEKISTLDGRQNNSEDGIMFIEYFKTSIEEGKFLRL